MKTRIQTLAIAVFLLISAVQFASAQVGMKLTGFLLPQRVTMRNPDDVALQSKSQDTFRYDPWHGMAGGLYFGYNPTEVFGMKTGIIYSQQGYKWSSKNTFVDRWDYFTRLDYVKIPVMFGLHTKYTDHKSMFTFYAGYQLGILTRVKGWDDVTLYQPPLADNITRYPSPYQIYNRYNHSLLAEAGWDIKMTRELMFNLHLRGDYSLGDAENKSVTYRVTDNGSSKDYPYWKDGRLATHNLNIGVLVGVTYNFLPAEKTYNFVQPKVKAEDK